MTSRTSLPYDLNRLGYVPAGAWGAGDDCYSLPDGPATEPPLQQGSHKFMSREDRAALCARLEAAAKA